MAILALERVRKVFSNGAEAVRELDLLVKDGEFVVLAGPSGCGKTTAVRMARRACSDTGSVKWQLS